jgi:hypothetical protein
MNGAADSSHYPGVSTGMAWATLSRTTWRERDFAIPSLPLPPTAARGCGRSAARRKIAGFPKRGH